LSRLDDVLESAFGPSPHAEVALPPGHQPYAPAVEPDEPTNSASFSVANGTLLDQRLGFRAGSCVIDNNTSSYLNVPDASRDGTGRWIPPGTGAAIPILGHISRARITWSAPPGKSQPPAVATEFAQVTFFAAPTPPGFGISSPSLTTRGTAFPLASYAIGTYNFNTPKQSFGRGIMTYTKVTAGGGTVTPTIFDFDDSIGSASAGALLTGAGLVVASGMNELRVYPGIAVTANVTANSCIGQQVQIQVVVTVAAATFQVDYEYLP
jgi:hypothetical protein